MIKKLYTVYDKKGETGLAVFESANDLVAIRDFSHIVANKSENNMIATYPDDYCLKLLGTYDTETGVIVSDVRVIAEAVEYQGKVSN